ncbi:MAG: tetratricopeptide repeat protein [Coriobacteriia bacterium]
MVEPRRTTNGRTRRRSTSLPLLIGLAVVAVLAIAGGIWLAYDRLSSEPPVVESEALTPADLESATAAYNSGDFTAAEDALEELIAENPEDLDARRSLALALSAQGKNDEALAQYATIVEAEPGDHETLYQMAVLERLLGDADNAVEHLEAAVDAEPAVAYLDDLARTYMQMGRYEDAVASWQRVLDVDSLDEAGQAGVYAAIATAHEGAREYDDAKEALEEALHLLPNDENLKARLEVYED